MTDGDLRRHMSDSLLNQHAQNIMTKTPLSLQKNASIMDAINLMTRKKITQIFIVDNKNYPVGILHIHNCLEMGS